MLATFASAQVFFPVSHADTGPAFIVDAADYGVVASTQIINQRDGINAAITAGVAARPTPRTNLHVKLPCHIPYAVSGQAVWWEGVINLHSQYAYLIGCGGAEVVRAVNDLGDVYYPTREVAERYATDSTVRETRLMVMPGATGRNTFSHNPDFPPSESVSNISVQPRKIFNTDDSIDRHHEAGLIDVVVDGNWRGNLEAVLARTDNWRETSLRNSPGHTGFNAGGNGRDLCEDQPLIIRNPATGGIIYRRPGIIPGGFISIIRSSVTGFAGTSLQGSQCTMWNLDTVVGGDALYNHVWYSADGVWRNVTLTGFAWTAVIVTGNTDVENFVYERPTINPFSRSRRNPDLFDVRAGILNMRGVYADTRIAEDAGTNRPDDVEVLIGASGSFSQMHLSDVLWRARRGGKLLFWSAIASSAERVRVDAPEGFTGPLVGTGFTDATYAVSPTYPFPRLLEAPSGGVLGLYMNDVSTTGRAGDGSLVNLDGTVRRPVIMRAIGPIGGFSSYVNQSDILSLSSEPASTPAPPARVPFPSPGVSPLPPPPPPVVVPPPVPPTPVPAPIYAQRTISYQQCYRISTGRTVAGSYCAPRPAAVALDR